MTADQRLARIEQLLTPPERGWSIIPLQQQAAAALDDVRALRTALATRQARKGAPE